MRFKSFVFSFMAVLIISVAASAQTFTNSAVVTSGDSSIGNPYPSTINVAGVNGTVSKVTVKLNSVGHTYPDDLGVLLVGPTGVKVRLMTDTGGGSGGSGGGAISGVNITFDDAATAFLPDGVAGDPAITTGTYKPTMGTGGAGQGTAHPANFPAPAPASPYALTLASFNSLNANGNWSLYVDDDAVGDTGSLAGGWTITFATSGGATRSTFLDFTGTSRSDFAVVTRATTGAITPITWKVAGNPAPAGANQAFIRIFNYGLRTDIPVPADFSGDSKSEVNVWRPGAQAFFYTAQFPNGNAGVTIERALQFGGTGDNSDTVGDYDGDGKTDYTVVRFNGTTGVLTWYIMTSVSNTFRAIPVNFPAETAQFVAARGGDFNGDGRDEVVFLSLDADFNETWYALDSVTGAYVASRRFGNFNTDYAVTPADYTGDGRADYVVVRETGSQAIWYINNGATNVTTATAFGTSGFTATSDIPVRSDFDGDGRQDIAIWRPTNQTFYWMNSSNGSLQGQQWGAAEDVPLGSFGLF